MTRAMVYRDPALWSAVLQLAARELGLPPRGEKGSAANVQRRNMMSKVQKRARELYAAAVAEKTKRRAEFPGDDFSARD